MIVVIAIVIIKNNKNHDQKTTFSLISYTQPVQLQPATALMNRVSQVTRYTSHGARHRSHVTRQWSRSRVTLHTSNLASYSVITGCCVTLNSTVAAAQRYKSSDIIVIIIIIRIIIVIVIIIIIINATATNNNNENKGGKGRGKNKINQNNNNNNNNNKNNNENKNNTSRSFYLQPTTAP
jgi:hypothetical protein